MSKRKFGSLIFALTVLLGCFVDSTAQAATGWVSGNWAFWNKNGNYCPTTNSCVGARYTQASFNTTLPISNARVFVWDSANAIIGQGTTDSSGNFNVSWTRTAFPSQIHVGISTIHARFVLENTAGQYINNSTPLVTTSASTSQASPQNIGGWQVGSSASPDPYYNAFWAGEVLWRNTLSLVGSATTNFTGIEIRGFADTIPGFLGFQPTSDTDAPNKRIQLDSNAAFEPQARMMHEMGHMQNYSAQSFLFTSQYDWNGNAGWSQNSAEWGAVAFEEGFATHYGSVALWGDNATTPTTCLTSQFHCYQTAGSSIGSPADNTDLEATSYPFSVNNCSTVSTNPESRWPLSAMRFFWDVFDNHNDADGDTYSASQGNFWQHLAMPAFYPGGTGANQINEPWNAALNTIDASDGRGSSSYAYNYVNSAGLPSISLLQIDNCTPF